MDREERLYKLDNGSDTAIWAANEIRRLEQALRDIRDGKDAPLAVIKHAMND